MDASKKTWTKLTANIELSEEQFFNEWFALETKFGEYGPPGITETYTNSRFPSINTIDNTADIRWTLYRAEDGKLVGLYGCYMNRDNLEQAFNIMIHPDYQRQGIATRIIEHNIERHKREQGKQVDFEKVIPQTNRVTGPGVEFANKLVQNVYDQEQ